MNAPQQHEQQQGETNIDPTIEIDQIDPEIVQVEQDQPAQPPKVLTAEEMRIAKLCQTCQKDDWKYTCPRCLVHSCSLTCVLQHKKEANCSGIRDKTSYVPLREYNESHMMSDYTYLEDISRQSDNLTRSRMDTTKDLKGKAAENKSRVFSKHANGLGIHYSALPVGMSRHKLNQSNYSKNLKQIFWSIEVNFCRGDKKERYLEHSFPSIKPFTAFFDNLLFAESPQGKGSYGIIRHQVKDFVDAGLNHFMVALKKEKAPRGHFVNMSQVMDLQFIDILKGETIIEYPVFYVWLKTDETPKDILVLEDKKQLITTITETLTPSEEMDTEVEVKEKEVVEEEEEGEINQEESNEEEEGELGNE